MLLLEEKITNFNSFKDNYKAGSAPTAEDHIGKSSGDCHMNYPFNYFEPN